MKRILCLYLMTLAISPIAAAEDCPPQGYSREQLLDLRAGGFVLESAEDRDELALSLTGCLSEPDPAIRDGVAHGSDLVLQLVLNPNINAGQIAALMNAAAVQVDPAGAVFYIYGEPGRLARAVFYAYTRGEVDEAFWEGWFERVSNPAPLDSWGAAFTSQAGLARRHNTMEFLLAMHLNASSIEGEQAERLDALVMRAITRTSSG